MASLFGKKQVSGAHVIFKHLRDSPFCERDREVIEDLWVRFEWIADSKFRSEFQRDTSSRIWEMRLGCALLSLGYDVSSDDHGPDLHVISPYRFDLEAIAMEEGKAENRVPRRSEGGSSAEIERTLRQRYFQAFKTKAQKIRRYRRGGKVETDVPVVIAISGSKIPEAYWEDTNPVPAMLELCFGVFVGISGDPTLHVGPRHVDGDAREPDNIFRPGLLANEDISAVLASAKDIKNSSEVEGLEPGRDFMVIHNPNARTPLPKGAIPLGREFWLDDGVLKKHVWRKPRCE